MVKNTTIYKEDSNYIKRPYHNPNLLKELEESKKQELLAKNKQIELNKTSEIKEMEDVCSNYYGSRRNNQISYYQTVYYVDFYGYQVNNYKVIPRKVYNYKKFKENCQNYYKENRLIKTIKN